MTPETVTTIGQQALWVTMLIAAPMLLSALAVGLLVGMFQAATQINEQTMTFVPKIVAVLLSLLLFAPWLIKVMLAFAAGVFTGISQVGN